MKDLSVPNNSSTENTVLFHKTLKLLMSIVSVLSIRGYLSDRAFVYGPTM